MRQHGSLYPRKAKPDHGQHQKQEHQGRSTPCKMPMEARPSLPQTRQDHFWHTRFGLQEIQDRPLCRFRILSRQGLGNQEATRQQRRILGQ